jgi:hypothetical protein
MSEDSASERILLKVRIWYSAISPCGRELNQMQINSKQSSRAVNNLGLKEIEAREARGGNRIDLLR